jgi:hypothetical protein
MTTENETIEQQDQQQEEMGLQEPPPQSEYTEIKAELASSMAMLSRMTKLSPQSLRSFLVNDFYPLLGRVVETTEWYVMDLHSRVLGVEEEEEAGGIDEESAGRLIEFVGRTVQLLGFIMKWAKDGNITLPDPIVTETQQLIVSAPGLMAMIQDLVVEEEDEDEEYDEDEEEDEEEDDGMIEPVSTSEKPEEQYEEPAAAAEPVVEAEPVAAAEPVAPPVVTPPVEAVAQKVETTTPAGGDA